MCIHITYDGFLYFSDFTELGAQMMGAYIVAQDAFNLWQQRWY